MTSRATSGPALPSPWNAARELYQFLGPGRVHPATIVGVALLWPVTALLGCGLVRPNTAVLKANGYALWMDGHAYWMAWRHAGLYVLPPRAIDAFLYSPAFAQALWPFTTWRFPVFAALWWAALVGAFWWLLRPLPWCWRLPALVLTGYEVQVGNINALLALMLVLAGRFPAVWSLALLTKITPGIGLLWYVARGDWRSLGRALGVTGLIVLASLPLGPHLWIDWLTFLAQSRHSPAGHGLLNAGTLPVRLALAAGLVIWGARGNRPWVLAVAVSLATPLVGLATISVLAALPRLVLQGRPMPITKPGVHRRRPREAMQAPRLAAAGASRSG